MIREQHQGAYRVTLGNGFTASFDYKEDDPAYVRNLINAATEYLTWREKWGIE